MQHITPIIVLIFLSFFAGGCATTVEDAKYITINQFNNFELRDYPPQIIAETEVEGSLEDAGDKAFKKLFDYISGENQSRENISMTSPVTQKPSSEKIEMTTPVGQERTAGGWMVSFMMPASYTLETLPIPDNPDVRLRQIPARRMASVRYSGTWSEKRYLQYLQELESWIAKNGFRILGEPVWARYNPPFTPWFMRRNEILIPVDSGEK